MKKNWKRVTAALLSGALALSLAGCMPTNQSAPASEGAAPAASQAGGTEATTAAAIEAGSLEVNTTDPISMRMNWWGGDNRHQATLNAIAAFEEAHPNIDVEAEYESFTGHEEKIALALRSGSAADVLQLNMDWVFNYSPDGSVFTDLNSLSNIIDLSGYSQEDLDYFTTNGVLQALPVSNTGRVFFWNKTVFDNVGVKIPTTLEELYAAGEAVANYEDGS